MNAAAQRVPRTARVTELAREAGKSTGVMRRELQRIDRKCGGMLLLKGNGEKGSPDIVNLDVLEMLRARAAEHIEDRLSGVEGAVQSLDQRVSSIEARINRRK